jgi:hypothetical protein
MSCPLSRILSLNGFLMIVQTWLGLLIYSTICEATLYTLYICIYLVQVGISEHSAVWVKKLKILADLLR